MTKTRIHELARELKMENKDLLKLLEKLGVEVKSVHSALEDSDLERVKNHLNLSKKEGLVEQRVKPTVIRRRVKKEEPLPAPEPPAPVKAQPAVGKPAERKAPVSEAPRKEEAPPAVKPLEKKAVGAKAEALPRRPEEVPTPLKPAPAPAPSLPAEEEREEAKAEGIPEAVEPKPAPPPEKAPEIPVEAKVIPPAEKPKAPPVERAKILEKPPEKPPVKPKKKHEPAKILERPAVPPPSITVEFRPQPSRTGPAAGHLAPPNRRSGAGQAVRGRRTGKKAEAFQKGRAGSRGRKTKPNPRDHDQETRF